MYSFLEVRPADPGFEQFLAVPGLIFPYSPQQLSGRNQFNSDLWVVGLLMMEEEKAVGRVALYQNPALAQNGKQVGILGNYECIDDQAAAQALLSRALNHLQALGAQEIIGPMNGSTWDSYRFALPSTKPAYFLEPTNPAYYPQQWTDFGFEAQASYVSSVDRTLQLGSEKVVARLAHFQETGVNFRSIRLDQYEIELRQIFEFCAVGFQRNFLFSPISAESYLQKYLPLQALIDPEFVLLAESAEGELVGMMFGFPDVANDPRKSLIIKTILRKPGRTWAGMGQVLAHLILQKARDHGFSEAVHALMREDGDGNSISSHFAGEVFRRYQLFGLNLPQPPADSANIVRLFLAQAKHAPAQLALIDRDGSQISYGDLAEAIRHTAAHFQAKGIRQGDRVLMFVPMSIDLYRCVLALFYLGATAVFLDEWVSKKRLALCCELVNCTAMIGSRKALALTWFLAPLRKLKLRLNTNYDRYEKLPEMVAVEAEETALVTFTTGSTGIPKAADRSHAFLQAQFEALRSEINPQAGEVAMPVLPIVLLINLGAGVCSVIADFPARKPRKMRPERLARQIKTHGVQRITSSPYFLERLSAWMQESGSSFPTVRQIFTGGAPVFPSLASQLSAQFPQTDISIVYGSTEAEPISLARAEAVVRQHLPQQGLYVGQPYEGGKLRVIPIHEQPLEPMNEAAWETYCLPAGQIGEIVVAGPHVLKKYIDNPTAWTRNKVVVDEEIWHRSGDAGFVRPNGELYLTGRCQQMFQREGEYVAPFLYEESLAKWPGVSAGTLLEMADELWLCLETEASDLNPFQAELAQLQPEPQRIWLTRRLPRDPRHHSKIEYSKLREAIQKGRGGKVHSLVLSE